MRHQLLELLGGIVVLVGVGTIVAAAAMVSVALATLVAGLALLVVGIVAIYVAAALESAHTAKTPPAGSEQP